MTDALQFLIGEALAEIAAAADMRALEAARVKYLGKEGIVSARLKELGKLPPEERKTAGAALNTLKNEISQAIETAKAALEERELGARLANETIDITLPVRPEARGGIHPVSQTLEEITAIFAAMGFLVAEGPEIEDDGHNFTALNIPPSHPARQMHDTFYLAKSTTNDQRSTINQYLLRTHTSPVQIRVMKSGVNNGEGPPFRFIAPGRTYRCDSDITHTPMFHQVEGLCIDKNIHMGHLKSCLARFVGEFFGGEVPVRFRPSFFPFTEPSAEMDIGCSRAGGEIKIGAGADWLEILGCGMVHPNVLHHCGVDPGEWQGFAFGVGVERLAMLKYGIPDLRTFFESDIRWLSHYGFSPFFAGAAA